MLLQTSHELAKATNVLGKLAGTFGNVIVTAVRDPPGLALVLRRNVLVQLHAVADIDFLVKAAVNDQDGAVDFFDAINVGINVQTSQETVTK